MNIKDLIQAREVEKTKSKRVVHGKNRHKGNFDFYRPKKTSTEVVDK